MIDAFDIFTLPQKPSPLTRSRAYKATWPCGSTWTFDRFDLEVPDFTDGDQNGLTYCFKTLGEAIATLEGRGCKVERVSA